MEPIGGYGFKVLLVAFCLSQLVDGNPYKKGEGSCHPTPKDMHSIECNMHHSIREHLKAP